MACHIGIRFSPIGNSIKNEETDIRSKHWAIVITPPSNCSRMVEVGEGEGGAVLITTTDFSSAMPYFPLAIYKGRETDSDTIVEAHPMRGTQYSTCFNNCQHFAATFLLLLQAYGCLTVTHTERMNKVLGALEKDGSRIYHSPNPYMEFARLGKVGLAGAALAGASVAAEATVATTIPAAGILGWFGATTTVLAPAAFAPIAAALVPVAALTTVGAGIGYMVNASSWKSKTMYDDPRISGFPYGKKSSLRRGGRAPAKILSTSAAWAAYSNLAYTALGVGSRVGAASAASMPAGAALAAPVATSFVAGSMIYEGSK